MKWKGRRRSRNIEDRRGQPSGRRMLGGGIGTLIVVLVAMYFGVDPSFLLQGLNSAAPSTATQSRSAPADLANDPLADMVSVVMADTEDVWHEIFAESGRRYVEPKLVLFTGSTRSACGTGQAATGPFYCPADQKAYIDLSFYEDLRTGFRAPGDFAQAYVIAHEVGHHVQNILGISGEMRRMQQGRSRAEANELSVRLELQADCFAGVWANRADRAKGILEVGDIEEALNAASAIGDDRLQRQGQGHVVPESFTHGSSAQRQRWFRRGLESGSPDTCDTFSAATL